MTLKRINITLFKEDVEYSKQKSKKLGLNRSSFIRLLLRQYKENER